MLTLLISCMVLAGVAGVVLWLVLVAFMSLLPEHLVEEAKLGTRQRQ